MPIGRIGQEFIVNSTATGSEFVPSITALADGRFVVTWVYNDGVNQHIRGRIFNFDGSAAGNDFTINTTAANDQTRPAVTALADGRFVVTWQSFNNGADYDIRGRVYNADGSPDSRSTWASTSPSTPRRRANRRTPRSRRWPTVVSS